MRRIDELHLELPFAGARMLRDLLRAEGFTVGRKHMTTLMRRMAFTALYRKPNTSKRAHGHAICPYLLRTLAITRSNHVWVMDITYIPMARGFVYLAAVIGWHSRRVLAWRLSRRSAPRPSAPCLSGRRWRRRVRGIRVSMDGKGCWRDNVFIERVWRSIKYVEEVYLDVYENVSAARQGIERYISFYNTPAALQPSSSNQDVVYFASLPQPSAEAA